MADEDQEILNPADDARNDVAAAIKQLKGDEPVEVIDDHPEPIADETAPEPVIVKADHPNDPNRYADGTFKPTKAEIAAKEAAPEITPPVDNTAKASVEQPSTAVGTPPVSWAAEAKANWNSLPPAIQTAVLKRESEVSSGFKQKSDEVRRYETAISPIAQEASRLGIPVEQGINALMSAHARISRDPAGFIVDLARQAGLDLAQLASNPPAPQAVVTDPAIPQVINEVTALKHQISEFQNLQLKVQIENFSKGKPYFEEIRQEMARIAPTLPESLSDIEILEKAYEQAIWLNPDVRAKVLAEQNAKAEADRVAALKVKEASARKAAISVKGSSNGAMPPPPVGSVGDVYDDVRNAISQLRQ